MIDDESVLIYGTREPAAPLHFSSTGPLSALLPDQPIFDIDRLTHSPSEGNSVSVLMTGDAYEKEEQRNWTEASLKTYIRSLSEPRPFTLLANESFEQEIVVSIAGAPPHRPSRERDGLAEIRIECARGATTSSADKLATSIASPRRAAVLDAATAPQAREDPGFLDKTQPLTACGPRVGPFAVARWVG